VDKAFLEFTPERACGNDAIESRRFTLGQAGGNDLRTPEDGTLSARHAVI
jgi:hypothetical protein